MDLKKARGRQIALLGGITKKGKVWLVPSQTRPGVRYKVTLNPKKCGCRDFKENGNCDCKHIHAARIIRTEYPRIELVDPDPVAQVAKEKKTYTQDWASYNEAQVNEGSLFLRLL